jgi:hypothetical protein
MGISFRCGAASWRGHGLTLSVWMFCMQKHVFLGKQINILNSQMSDQIGNNPALVELAASQRYSTWILIATSVLY